jgi:hypothetical protein
MITILVFLVVLFFIIFFINKKEPMDDVAYSDLKTNKAKQPATIPFEILEKQRVLNNNNVDIFNNYVFSDTLFLENDSERTGIDKCIDTKISQGGECVEYGISGNAFYFPNKKVLTYGEMSDLSFTLDEKREAIEGFESFPNLR